MSTIGPKATTRIQDVIHTLSCILADKVHSPQKSIQACIDVLEVTKVTVSK